MQIHISPRITTLARPQFLNPDHFPFKPDNNNAQDLTEFAARLCYLSFGSGQIDGHKTVQGRKNRQEYFENLKQQKHGSVMEHANFSFLIEGISRSLTHELVRHRAGFAYSQLSQRFVEAQNVGFVLPPAIQFDTPEYAEWKNMCEQTEKAYQHMITKMEARYGTKISGKKVREAARSILPNCTETKIVVTANVRSWRHFLTKRGGLGADAEIQRLAFQLLIYLKAEASYLFEDITEARNEMGLPYIKVEYESV